MTVTPRFVFAAALTFSLAGPTLANDAEKTSPYPPVNILKFFTKEMKAELRVTADQDRRLEAIDERRNKIWQKHSQVYGKIANAKLPQREKNAKLRALDTQLVDDLCKLYGEALQPEQVKRMKQIALQVRGMEIFDHAEVQKAPTINDAYVQKLKETYYRLAREASKELRAQVAAKKITDKEAAKQAIGFTFSVPEGVRATLSEEQQRTLHELLGKKYIYK